MARYGSRGLALNAWLCGQVGACESLDALCDCARAFDAELIAAGLGSLQSDELVKRTAAVWKAYQDGKIEPWAGARAVARSDAEEIKDLCARSARNGGDAFALLMLLRAEHAARIQRGETFALRTEAMEKCETLPGWTAERIVKARNVLLKANYLREVEAARNTRDGRLEANYTLVPRALAAFSEAPGRSPTQDFRHGQAQPENLGGAQPEKTGMGSPQPELTHDDVRQFRAFLDDCAAEALRRMRDGEGEAQPPLGIPVPAHVLEEWTAEETVELETKALLQIKAILESEGLSAEEKRSRIEAEVNAVRTRNGA